MPCNCCMEMCMCVCVCALCLWMSPLQCLCLYRNIFKSWAGQWCYVHSYVISASLTHTCIFFGAHICGLCHIRMYWTILDSIRQIIIPASDTSQPSSKHGTATGSKKLVCVCGHKRIHIYSDTNSTASTANIPAIVPTKLSWCTATGAVFCNNKRNSGGAKLRRTKSRGVWPEASRSDRSAGCWRSNLNSVDQYGKSEVMTNKLQVHSTHVSIDVAHPCGPGMK